MSVIYIKEIRKCLDPFDKPGVITSRSLDEKRIKKKKSDMHRIRHFVNRYEREILLIVSSGTHFSCFQIDEDKDSVLSLNFLVRGYWGQSKTLKNKHQTILKCYQDMLADPKSLSN